MPMNPRLMRPRANISWDTVSSGIVGFWWLSDEMDTSGNNLHFDFAYSALVDFSPSVSEDTVLKVGTGSLYVMDLNAYLAYSAALPPFGTDITIAGWFKTISAGNPDESILLTNDSHEVSIRFYFGDVIGKAGGDEAVISTNFRDGQWHFFCLRREGATTKLRIDATEASAGGGLSPLGSSLNNFYLGGDPNALFPSEAGAYIDAVGMWRRALSDAEVQWLGDGREYYAGIHAEASDWADRVLSNNGSVSPTTLTAVSNFCKRIDSANLRSKFARLNLLCGTDLNAMEVPLYRSNVVGGSLGAAKDARYNLNTSDYSEPLGVLRNGRFLWTGISPSEIYALFTGMHMGFVVTGDSSTYNSYMGAAYSRTSQAGNVSVFMHNNTVPQFSVNGANSSFTTPSFLGKKFIHGSASPFNHFTAVGGVSGAVTWPPGPPYATGYIAAISGRSISESPPSITGGGTDATARSWMYSLGGALTAAENATLNNILTRFFTSIGRT